MDPDFVRSEVPFVSSHPTPTPHRPLTTKYALPSRDSDASDAQVGAHGDPLCEIGLWQIPTDQIRPVKVCTVPLRNNRLTFTRTVQALSVPFMIDEGGTDW